MDGYDDSSNSSTESKRPITVILKTIGGQVDHECDDDHRMGEDGECYKVETHSDVDAALNQVVVSCADGLLALGSQPGEVLSEKNLHFFNDVGDVGGHLVVLLALFFKPDAPGLDNRLPA